MRRRLYSSVTILYCLSEFSDQIQWLCDLQYKWCCLYFTFLPLASTSPPSAARVGSCWGHRSRGREIRGRVSDLLPGDVCWGEQPPNTAQLWVSLWAVCNDRSVFEMIRVFCFMCCLQEIFFLLCGVYCIFSFILVFPISSSTSFQRLSLLVLLTTHFYIFFLYLLWRLASKYEEWCQMLAIDRKLSKSSHNTQQPNDVGRHVLHKACVEALERYAFTDLPTCPCCRGTYRKRAVWNLGRNRSYNGPCHKLTRMFQSLSDFECTMSEQKEYSLRAQWQFKASKCICLSACIE